MKYAIIFDIDGTLANIDHRLHFIKGEKKDYDAFFAACVDDLPKKDIIELNNIVGEGAASYDNYNYKDEFVIIICTGRPEDYREQTETWLKQNWVGYETLVMRPSGDHRADYIIKEEMLKKIQADGYNVLFTIDDRQQVVDMWRRNGITCLQCAQWEEDAPIRSWPLGKLTLMVGPSGAGKTSWIVKNTPKAFTISSDYLRDFFTGDFKDQSDNGRVFSYIHETVRMNIEHGCDITIDCTNIKTRDRKAMLACCPPNTEITYIVIDRPLAEKFKDGGWRNDVMIKGETLIKRHHTIFQSNLKAILEGDNDPRVTVKDMRHGV